MKKIGLLLLFFILVLFSKAQPMARQALADSVLGWMKWYHFKGAKAGIKIDDKLYSAQQLSVCDSFANWIQASYLPKGGLGDVKKAVSEKLGLYNQHTAGKPLSYGAYAKTYFELKRNAGGKLEPLTNSHVWWAIMANGVPGDWPVRDICTPDQYYFTLPTAETEVDDPGVRELLDLTGNKNIQPFISFWVKNMGFGRGREQVLLSKDNRSPFIIINRGEYLQALENALPFFYAAEKKKIIEAEQGVPARVAVDLKHLEEKMEGYRSGIIKNREKYLDRLGEPALTGRQPGLADLASGRDVFSGQYLTDPPSHSVRYPVYQIDPVRAALCKKDPPQWILISWDYYPGDATEQQQHQAITSHFNFGFVYRFFFEPAAVRGKAYQPLLSPGN